MACDCKQCRIYRVATGGTELFKDIGSERATEALEAVAGSLAGMLTFFGDDVVADTLRQILVARHQAHLKAGLGEVAGHA